MGLGIGKGSPNQFCWKCSLFAAHLDGSLLVGENPPSQYNINIQIHKKKYQLQILRNILRYKITSMFISNEKNEKNISINIEYINIHYKLRMFDFESRIAPFKFPISPFRI